MSISDLLMSQKRWGRARCKRLLTSIGVPENKAVGTLTERQRSALAEDGAEREVRRPPRAPLRALSVGLCSRLAPRPLQEGSGVIPGPAVASSTMCPSGSRR